MKKTPIIDVNTGRRIVRCEHCNEPMLTSPSLPYFGPAGASGGAYICTNPKCPGKGMKCMDCGKPIKQKREAPSGSWLPRCAKCNDKRWKKHYSSESEQLGKTSPGIGSNEWDDLDYPW